VRTASDHLDYLEFESGCKIVDVDQSTMRINEIKNESY